MGRLLRALLIGLCLSFLVFVGISANYPLDPVMDNTDKFDRRYHLTSSFPFVASSLLLVPRNYDPNRVYPLVLALHGGYKRSAGAFVAAQDKVQQRYEAFVVMPMALLGEPWVAPNAAGSAMGPSKSLSLAMEILKEVVSEYSIDHSRVYVTGSSNGAVGTFAAMVFYPDTFAAGIPVNGWWYIEDARTLSSFNLAIYHGEEDPLSAVGRMRELVASIRAAGGRPKFIEMSKVGHDSWPAYRQPALWDWLFSQRLGR